MSRTSPVTRRQIHASPVTYSCAESQLTVYIGLALKISVVEYLDRNFLLVVVLFLQLRVVDSDILLDVLAWERHFLVLPILNMSVQ
jgi:hypothetical protein